MSEELIRKTIIDMIRDGGLQIGTYIYQGNFRTEIVTEIGTNMGEHGYEMLKEFRSEINIRDLLEPDV